MLGRVQVEKKVCGNCHGWVEGHKGEKGRPGVRNCRLPPCSDCNLESCKQKQKK